MSTMTMDSSLSPDTTPRVLVAVVVVKDLFLGRSGMEK